MLKLKLQNFGHLMQTDSLEKTLMLGKIKGRRRRGWQRMRWLHGITDSMDLNLNKLPRAGDGQGGMACCSPWGRKESDTTEQLNWTEILVNYQALCFTSVNFFCCLSTQWVQIRLSYVLCQSDLRTPWLRMKECTLSAIVCIAHSRYWNVSVLDMCGIEWLRILGLHINSAFLPNCRREGTLLHTQCLLHWWVYHLLFLLPPTYCLPPSLFPEKQTDLSESLGTCLNQLPSLPLCRGSQQPRGRRHSSLFWCVVCLMGIVTEGSLVQTSVGWNPVAECILRAQYLIVTRQKQSIRKEINPETTPAEAETPVLWPPDAKSRLLGKDPDAGKDWRQEEKGTTEEEMLGWYHRLYGRESE